MRKQNPANKNHQLIRKVPKSDNEFRREAEAKKKVEQQKKELERQKLLSLKQKEENEKEQKRKQEQARKRQEALKKQESDRVRLDKEKLRLERERQRNEREALQQAALREKQRLQDAQQLENDQIEQAKYVAIIKSLISHNWNRPLSARNQMVADIQITLTPFGDVRSVSKIQSSGNEEFDRSVIQAIQLSTPFRELRDMDRRLFDQYFRQFILRFKPEDLER